MLGRAVAVGQVQGAAAGLREADRLREVLGERHRWHAVHGYLHELGGDLPAAATAYAECRPLNATTWSVRPPVRERYEDSYRRRRPRPGGDHRRAGGLDRLRAPADRRTASPASVVVPGQDPLTLTGP